MGAVRKEINECVESLRKLASNMGAYMNEVSLLLLLTFLMVLIGARAQANFEEPGFRHEFWGSNYERLYVFTD